MQPNQSINHTQSEDTLSLSYPSRKDRRPKRKFGWLQFIVALFICVILITALGMGGYLTGSKTGNESYETLSYNDNHPVDTRNSEDTKEPDAAKPGNETEGTAENGTGQSGTSTDSSAPAEGQGNTGDDLSNEQAPLIPEESTVTQPDAGTDSVSADGTQYHIVAQGENLYRLTLKYYGTADAMDFLMKANKLDSPDQLTAGMKLAIPPRH